MGDEFPGNTLGYFDTHARTLGAVLLVGGVIFGFIAYYFPINDALQGAEKVSYYPKAIFVCVMLILAGVGFIILGPIAARTFLRVSALTGWKKWLFLAAIIIPLIGCAELVQHVFEQYLGGFGYTF